MFAAASTRDILEKLAAAFEDSNKVHLQVSAAASNQLAMQIQQGAPADIFISASPEWTKSLAEVGFVARQHDYLGNRLAVIFPGGKETSVKTPSDLLGSEIQRISLAGENVPAGMYAQEALEKLGIREEIAAKKTIVRGGDVRVALAYVERGEVDAGIVYATDAKSSRAVKTAFLIDENLHATIAYPIALLKQGSSNPKAVAFFEYLDAAYAREMFKEAGFIIRERG